MSLRETVAFEALGATLFIPALHKNLEKILLQNYYPELKSLVIDTEDGLDEVFLDEAMKKIEELLAQLSSNQLYIFLRPKNPAILGKFLAMKGVEKIEGFVLPKFSLLNAKEYLSLMEISQHSFMPSIEGDELFDVSKLQALKELLLECKKQIVMVRFGLEDMLSHLNMRRERGESLFDFSAPSYIVGNFIATFKSAGFGVSGGVYPYFSDEKGFLEDAKRDLKEGLFTKTIIHPSQIKILHDLYKVNINELNEAEAILKSSTAVFALDGKMAEKQTMQNYALFIKKRSKIYGVRI